MTTGSCDKKVTTRIGKANSAFKSLEAPESSRTSNQNSSHFCSLYCCTVPKNGQSQKQTGSVLKASIIPLSEEYWTTWKDKVTNENVQTKTNQSLLECTFQRIRLRWFGHVQRMENVRRARQALHWIPTGKRKTEDYMERNNNQWYQPDEYDMGWNLSNSNGQQEWRVWTAQCASHWKQYDRKSGTKRRVVPLQGHNTNLIENTKLGTPT